MKGMERQKRRRGSGLRRLAPMLALAALAAAFLVYAGQYYRADETTRSMLESDEAVSVVQTD